MIKILARLPDFCDTQAMHGLTHEQKLQLYEQGYVIIPQVVPEKDVKAALRAINSSMGQHMDTRGMTVLGPAALFPELPDDPHIIQLFNSDALSIAEAALGHGKIVLSKNIQVALRFPTRANEPEKLEPHVDSYHPSVDGTAGTIRPFTAIAAIFLNDVQEDWAGNFTVWPGTHRSFGRYFKQHGTNPDLRYGIPPVELPEPVQIKARAGDLLFAPHQLAHTASSNLSDAIRYAVFFRMNHMNQGKAEVEILSDIWRYWEGLKDVVTRHSND